MLASSALFQDEVARFLKITSRPELATWLHLSDRKLRFILYVLTPEQRYRQFDIPKRHGGKRTIFAPSKALMRIQRHLHEVIAHVGQPSSAAQGFVKGRSVVDHAKAHQNRRWVLCVDLKDFFPTIKFWRIRGMFMAAPFSFNEEVATSLAQICTHDQMLAQGAPTSPAISNIICRELDRRMRELARRLRCSYTRYADDLCISSNIKDVPAALATEAGDCWGAGEELVKLIEGCGFTVNQAKTKLKTQRDQQMVTGLVVNKKVAMPRAWRRQLRVMLHLRQKYGEEKAMSIVKTWAWHGVRRKKQKTIDAVIRGKAAFAAHVEKDRAMSFTRSIFYAYPRSRELIPRPYRGYGFRVLTEGVTDVDHLMAAHRRMSASGHFDELAPNFPDIPIKGSRPLVQKLELIAKSFPEELTIGVVDGDEPDLLQQHKLEPGQFKYMGGATYLLCLGAPAWVDGAFCIEDLYPWEQASAFADGRRIFKWSEFGNDEKTADGLYHFVGVRKTAVYVSDKVERVTDGFSALLSKQKFAQMVLNRDAPFEEMDFSGFASTFDAFRKIVEHHLARRASGRF